LILVSHPYTHYVACICLRIVPRSNSASFANSGFCLIVQEEAAYVDPGFFYETVAPLLLVGRASLLAISTLTSEYNFYTRLIKMFDVATGRPMFHSIQVQLACTACIEDGKTASCVHMLHLIPRWQSSERHTRLKTIMQDRPDLIESELSGLAFDSLQCCFRSADIEVMYTQPGLPPVFNEPIYIVIDPAAGGPGSDYAAISFTRNKGLIQVRVYHYPIQRLHLLFGQSEHF
jgi:hypothetical protein